jgi:hypothetical protein
MSEATQKMIDYLDKEIARLESEIAIYKGRADDWKACAERARAFNFGDWFTYNLLSAAIIFAGVAIGGLIWEGVRWAAHS